MCLKHIFRDELLIIIPLKFVPDTHVKDGPALVYIIIGPNTWIAEAIWVTRIQYVTDGFKL